jgi:phage terminase large subunit-like protein
MFHIYGRKCLSRKAVHNWVKEFSQGRSKSQMMPDQVQKWLRQQPKDFYAAGFEALVKQWAKCTNVDGGYVKK